MVNHLLLPWSFLKKQLQTIPNIVILSTISSLVVQVVKNPPAMQETSVQSLGWDDPLEKGKATHASILAWRIPFGRGTRRATVHRVTKS